MFWFINLIGLTSACVYSNTFRWGENEFKGTGEKGTRHESGLSRKVRVEGTQIQYILSLHLERRKRRKFKSSTLTNDVASTPLAESLVGVALGISVSCFGRVSRVSSETVCAVSAGSLVTGSTGEGSAIGETPFTAECSDGGTVGESTRSDSGVPFETVIMDS